MGRLDDMVKSDVPAVVQEEGLEPVGGVPRVRYKKSQTVDPSSIRVSMLRLAQGLTKEVMDRMADQGQFLVEGYAPVDSLDIVPLATQKTRSYRPDRNAPAQCVAPEGDFGYGDPGGPCAECPLSHWGERNPATGKSMPPPCTEAIMVRAYSLQHQCLIDIMLKNQEMRVGSFIAQQALSRHFGNFALRLTASKTQNAKGTWYVPVATMLDEIPEADRDLAERWKLVNDALIEMEAGGDVPF